MSALVTLAGSAGLKIVEKIIANKLGDGAGQLAGDVLGAIAEQVGVPVDQLDQAAEDQPAAVTRALQTVEDRSPELIALYAAGLELQKAQLAADAAEPRWMRAWRPAGMYLLGLFWIWSVIIVHVINGAAGTALPPVPLDQLVQISGLYMGLYMGGHTIKDAMTKWAGAK
ncbi:hypothetical protein FBT96_20010 [Rhodobacter capsulatus]|uniref:Holin of 3TMs, for gene-transfer release n=1 Tax=Rhodobacter capsulatus TaxID=1061 RepID=A0A4U1JJM8_RHOCA|nr:hypothetical protein [Rhodobacter capsulatus]TKD12911.1 hypothetical protein FBT96_20010 [Rhodobacter capsulatus]